MSRKVTIFALAAVALIAALIAGYSALPKRYSLADRLYQTTIFWNDREAFLFLNTNSTGRIQNFVLDRLGKTRYGYWALFFSGGLRFLDTGVIAYHLVPSGELKQVPLPPQTTDHGDWDLREGNLQNTPTVGGYNDRNGFRWDGDKFVPVTPKQASQAKEDSTLSPDDDDEEGNYPGFLRPAARKAFKAAGWHYKILNGYETKGEQAVLPLSMGGKSFDVKLTKPPKPAPDEDRLDLLATGIDRIQITSGGQTPTSQDLWVNRGWREVSKREFEERVQRSGRPEATPYSMWIWLGVFLLLMVWKFTGWGFVLMNAFGTKKRILNNMATAYSFPPATPARFPLMDTEGLERFTRELEALGYTRLLDFSLVPNTAKPIPSFVRIFANTRNHCFAEVSQVFPPRKAPRPIGCSIQSCLQDGWTISFSNRKPMAASSLLRRKKAIGVCVPETPLHELQQSFLKMREQVCQELGISFLRDDSLEAYFAKVQRSATDMREAVKQKSFAAGIPEYYYRRFSLLKTKAEYVWLGDYPKEAARRKQGIPVGAGGF